MISRLVRPTLIVYELLITFEQEVALIWQRKFTFASGFIMWIRWTLAFEIVGMVPYYAGQVRQRAIHIDQLH